MSDEVMTQHEKHGEANDKPAVLLNSPIAFVPDPWPMSPPSLSDALDVLAQMEHALGRMKDLLRDAAHHSAPQREERLLTAKEAAAFLRMKEGRVRELGRRGVIVTAQMGKFVRFRPAALREYVVRCETKS